MSELAHEMSANAPHRRRWVALVALLIAEAMNLLDATIVQVAAPTIAAELGGAVSDIPWFAAAYTLPFAALLITGGRLGDLAGRRRVFRLGVTVFMLSSLACALSPNVGSLIGARMVQGIAAALIIPQTIGLIKAMFTGPEMSTALGSIGPVMGLAAVLGPVLGGVLTHADLFGWSWRAVFLVNIPLSVAVLTIAPAMMENHAPARPGLDPLGTLLATTGITLIVYPVVDSDRAGVGPTGWLSIGAGVLSGLAFAVHQRYPARSGTSRLLETSLFRSRVFCAALVTSTLFFAVTTGLTLVVVLEMQLGQHADVLTAGLTLLPWSIGMAAASWVCGAYLVPRFGARVMPLGLGVVLVGLAGAVGAYATAMPGRYPTGLLAALAVVGLGVGLFSPSFFTAALHVVRAQEVGSAAGLLNAVQQVGSTLGVAVLASVYLTASNASPAGALSGAQITFSTAIGLTVASALSSLLMIVHRPRSSAAPHDVRAARVHPAHPRQGAAGR